VHFSVLPKYRGASPIQSALLNGDNRSGISIIKMSEDLDAGDIVSSFNVKINPEDNKLTLEKRLTDKCIEELPKILDLVKSNKIELKKQDGSNASYCKKIIKSDSIIDFDDKSINIINKFRAYYEWPGLSFLYKDTIIKIHEIEEVKINNNNKPGTINKLDKNGLYINTRDSVVVITYLQFPNKKIISSLDVYNSYMDFFQ
jgi:methionyl-tRNA formyltransferase